MADEMMHCFYWFIIILAAGLELAARSMRVRLLLSVIMRRELNFQGLLHLLPCSLDWKRTKSCRESEEASVLTKNNNQTINSLQ